MKPILADPDDYGQAVPPAHFKALTFEQFAERLELCAALQLGNADGELLDALADVDDGGGHLVSTCYHEAGHAVAAVCGFCDTIPSAVFARSNADHEGRHGQVVTIAGRALVFLQPWQLTLLAVQTCAAAVVEAYLAQSATVHPYGGDMKHLEALGAFGSEPHAIIERKTWALVLAEWERIERLANALARDALASHQEGDPLVGRLSWKQVTDLLEVTP